MKITLFSNSIVVSYIYNITLISTLEKLFNWIVASYISIKQSKYILNLVYISLDSHKSLSLLNKDKSITLVAIVAIAINRISTSSHAAKITIFASKS